MSLQEQQTFLARLFIDERLRQSFLQNPDNIGSENGLDKTDIAQLKDILPHELDMFSNSLFYKRASEVEKILPLTCGVLGSDFRKSFREFSLTFATKSIKKHLEDAVQFVNYLQQQKPKDDWIIDLARYEQSRITFNGYGKFFALGKFNFDIRRILNEVSRNVKIRESEFPKRKTIAVWLRIGKSTKHFII